MTGAGPQAVMRRGIISIILTVEWRWRQSAECRVSPPLVTTFITLSYHSYNSYNSCPHLTWSQSIYHITSLVSVSSDCSSSSFTLPSSAPLLLVCVYLHQDPAPGSVLTVYRSIDSDNQSPVELLNLDTCPENLHPLQTTNVMWIWDTLTHNDFITSTNCSDKVIVYHNT